MGESSSSSSRAVSLLRWLVNAGLYPARKVASALVLLLKERGENGTLAGTAGRGAAVLAAFFWTASRAMRLKRYLYPHTEFHPGTAAWRELVDNPVIPPEQFERKFIATPALLSHDPYDFIIVGAGSAGCVLAARLAKCAGVRILLIEAGGEAQNAQSVTTPNQALNLWRSEVDWGFRSVPQKHLRPANRTVNLERGLTLGGSSSINWMLWVQGQKEDFDRWEKQWGCGPDWSWDACKGSYERIERVTSDAFGAAAPASHRGSSGKMEPSVLHPPLREVDDFMSSFEKVIGAGQVSDYNAASQRGVGPMQYTVKGSTGRRSDAFTTFVDPVLRTHPNLTIASEGFVRRLILDGLNYPTVRGVELELNDGTVLNLHASQEVILCAGAIGSPHILMHSGIGDKSHLESVGVHCAVHSPAVGQNLQDHPTVFVPALLREPWDHLRQSSPGLHGIGFAQSPEDARIANEEGFPRGPDCEFYVGGRLPPQVAYRQVAQLLNRKFMELGAADMSSSKPVWRTFLAGAKVLSGSSAARDKISRLLILAGEMNHVESRGSVRLVSSDPHAPPAIDPNYFGDPRDIKKLVWFTRQILEIMKQPAFFNKLESVDFPAPKGAASDPSTLFDDISDEDIEMHVRTVANTTWHYSCTARMGATDDDSAVCTPHLEVKGVSGLRIADASVMPFVNSANTNAICMLIGDRAADFIVRKHGLVARTTSRL